MLVIKVGKTLICKLRQLEDLGYKFGVTKSIIDSYSYAYASYGDSLCFGWDYTNKNSLEEKLLTYSPLRFYQNNYSEAKIVTLDEFLQMEDNLTGKYIVAKIDNGYRVLKLESDHYVTCSDNVWKELDWAISEKEVMEKYGEE